jgi:urease accessory protein
MPAPLTPMTRSADPGFRTAAGLYRLLAWSSPSFPTGGFSYSHGLEAAVDDGTIRDRASLQAWIAAVLAIGSGRIDADILRDAYSAAAVRDVAVLDAANRRGAAYRATAELALESAQQAEAFLVTHLAAWAPPRPQKNHPSPPSGGRGQGEGRGLGVCGEHPPHPDPLPPQARGEGEGWGAFVGDCICYAAMFGAAAAQGGIALEDALIGYLHAFAGNLVSAGIRLGVIGQTDGQRILAALEPIVANAARAAMTRDPADFGSATFAADLGSMAHETQYSRLFRS